MKKVLILLIFLFASKFVLAQNYTKKYSSLSPAGYYDSRKSASYATNDNGSIYTSLTSNNLDVVKLNSTGCIEWSFIYDFGTNSKGSVIKQLSDGNYLVCGTADTETIAMKIDIIGNIIWSKKYDLMYGEPIDFAQNGSEVIILAGPGGGWHTSNNTVLKIDETTGNLINSKTINRTPLETADTDLLCRFSRVISTSSGYVLGGFAFMDKYFGDPSLSPSYSPTPIITYLDASGNVIDGRYFTEGSAVKEIIQTSGGQFIIAIENHDSRYLSTIPYSINRMSLFKVSTFGIWWQKTYVPPSSAINYIANQIPNNMEFTNTGDILIAGFVDQGALSGIGIGNYIFKVNSNGNLLSDQLVLNNSLNQGVTGLKITPTNDFIVGMYAGGMKRFSSSLSTSLCGYNPIPLVEYDDTVTSMVPTGMTEEIVTVNAIAIAPIKTIANTVATTLCGTTCPLNLPCYDYTTTSLNTGLLAYYPFSAGSLDDYSGLGNHLSNTTTAHPTTDRNGNLNCAYNFTKANNEKIGMSSPTFLDNLTASPFSISLWYKPIGTRPIGDYELLVGRDNGLHCPDTFGQWSLGLYDCRKVVVGFDMNSHWQTSTIPDCNTLLTNISNQWHHTAFVFDGTNYKVYVDGVLDTNTHGPCGSMASNIGNFLLGKDYTGDLDDVLIYNRALTNSEVIQLQGLGSSCCSDSPLSTVSLLPLKNFVLFPNPTNNFIKIQDNENSNANFEYKILDLVGRMVKNGRSKFNEDINVENLTIGKYIIQIETEYGEKITKKLIKN